MKKAKKEIKIGIIESEPFEEHLINATELIKSALAIAKRKGNHTHWDAFEKRCLDFLNQQRNTSDVFEQKCSICGCRWSANVKLECPLCEERKSQQQINFSLRDQKQ